MSLKSLLNSLCDLNAPTEFLFINHCLEASELELFSQASEQNLGKDTRSVLAQVFQYSHNEKSQVNLAKRINAFRSDKLSPKHYFN